MKLTKATSTPKFQEHDWLWIPSAAQNIKSLCVSYITSFKLTLCFTSHILLVSTWRNILQVLVKWVWFLIAALSLGFNITSHSVQFLNPQSFHKNRALEIRPQSNNTNSYFCALNWTGPATCWQGEREDLTQHNSFPQCNSLRVGLLFTLWQLL